MTDASPVVPAGSGAHPIVLVTIAAPSLRESSAFYAELFGWSLMPMSAQLTAATTPGGPAVGLRADTPAGAPASVPFIGVRDVQSTLARVIEAGGHIDREPWTMPMVGTMARFTDPSGTLYGLSTGMAPAPLPSMPLPTGDNPRPPAGAICSVEMYACDNAVTPAFFRDVFGWGTADTMPAFVGFDPGGGIQGVFQTHTPGTTAVSYIHATDVAAMLVRIDAAGGHRMGDAMAIPGFATFGYFTDPSGTMMGLIGG